MALSTNIFYLKIIRFIDFVEPTFSIFRIRNFKSNNEVREKVIDNLLRRNEAGIVAASVNGKVLLINIKLFITDIICKFF